MDQIEHMLVREGVKKVLPLPPSSDQTVAAQEAQALRNGGKLLAEGLHNLRDAAFAAREQFQQPQPRRIAQGAEDAARALQRLRAGAQPGAGGMIGQVAVGNRFGDGAPQDSLVHRLMK